jgi:phosphatidylglycerol:prolipoprotein diacylglycerol transferase
VLWRLRDRFRTGILFAIYLICAGTERFLVEFVRRNEDVALGLTQAQLLSVGMILAGAIWIAVARSRGSIRARPADLQPFGGPLPAGPAAG